MEQDHIALVAVVERRGGSSQHLLRFDPVVNPGGQIKQASSSLFIARPRAALIGRPLLLRELYRSAKSTN